MKNTNEKEKISLSVVIATLGGAWLKNTIETLMAGSTVPDEILICIPESHAYKAETFRSDVVKIIATEVKGQVRQRAYGFTQVKFPIVLQLDDDILLEKDTVSNMVQYLLQLGKGNVIGPVYYGLQSKKCIHALQTGFAAIPKNIFDWLICGAPWGLKKMGIVSCIGLNYGVDDQYCKETLKQTDWLPGGCVFSFKEDLILENFFPFTGKAYCEDVYHSFFRKQAGTKSWVATLHKVFIEVPEPEFSKNAVEKVIAIRRFYLKLINGPQWRLFLYEIFCRLRSRFYVKPD